MTTYSNARVASGISPRSNQQGLTSVTATQTVSTALTTGDVIEMVKVPRGAKVLDVILTSEDLDTGTTATIVLDVGDGGDTDRWIDGATTGQAGGTTRMNVATGLDHSYTADDTIDVLVQAGPATGATGVKITLTVLYTQHP